MLGTLRPEAAEALGLSPALPRSSSAPATTTRAALGAGALAPGVVVDVTGTAEPVAVPAREAVIDDERPASRRTRTRSTAMLLVENPGFVSGGSTRWWAATQRHPQAEVFALAALAPPGAAGALFVPALSGSMAPRWNDRMRGAFAGLAMNHGGEHLARAVLEGCAYALRDIVDRFGALGIGGDEIRVVGGGARSPLWLQIKADVTGLPVRPCRGDAATSAGAAMLAGVAAGNFADLEAAAEAIGRARRRAGPAATRATADLYADAYGRYRRLFDGDRAGAGVSRASRTRTSRATSPRCARVSPRRRGRLRPLGLGGVLLGPGVLDELPGVVADVRRASGDVAVLADRRGCGRDGEVKPRRRRAADAASTPAAPTLGDERLPPARRRRRRSTLRSPRPTARASS